MGILDRMLLRADTMPRGKEVEASQPRETREEKQSKVLTLALLEYTYGLCLNFEVKSELHTLLW